MKRYRFRLRLMPVILFTAFVILLVRACYLENNADYGPDFPIGGSSELWDVFSYAKSSAIFAITVCAIVFMAYLLITGQLKIKKTVIYVPMFIYAVCIIASYALSDYKTTALIGGVTRYEGTRTVLCYLFMLFYTINVVDDLSDVAWIVLSTAAGVFLACLLGIYQLFHCDLFKTGIGKFLVLGTKDATLSVNFLPGQVYQTVSNMNYVGMYLSLVVPVLVYAIYYLARKENRITLASIGIYNEKRQMMICITGILLFMVALNILGAGSLGGVIGTAVSVTSLLILMVPEKWQKILILSVCLAGIIVTLAYTYVHGNDDHTRTGHKQIEYIETGIDCVNMSVDGNEISIRYSRNTDEYELKDGDNNPVSIFWYADEEGIYQVDDPRFAGKMRIIPIKDENGEACVVVDIMDIEWESFGFTFYEDGAKYLNPYGQEVSLSKVDSVGFNYHLSAGSKRGYIWSRTIPLIKNRFFTGAGADTFALLFPQNDYAGKYSAGMHLFTTVDKPHSMYLGMITGTGVLSLISFLTMVGISLWKVFHLGDDKKIIKVIATGIVGFLVAGIFNDSTVSIMPMFYGLWGTVIAMSI